MFDNNSRCHYYSYHYIINISRNLKNILFDRNTSLPYVRQSVRPDPKTIVVLVFFNMKRQSNNSRGAAHTSNYYIVLQYFISKEDETKTKYCCRRQARSTNHNRHVSSGVSIDEMFRHAIAVACAIVAFILMPGTLGVAVRGKDRHVRAVASSPLRGSHRPKDDTAKHKIEQFIRITSFIQRANGAIDTKNQRKKSFNLLRKLVRSPPVTQPSAPATESQNNHRFIEKRSEAEVQQSAAAAASQRMAVQQAQEAKQGLFLGSGVRAPPGAMQLINTPYGRRMGFSPGFAAGAHRFASPGVHLQIPGVATRTFAGHQVDAVLPPTSPPPPAMIDSPPLPQEAYRQAALQ